jgi:hypothetical protein
MARKLRIGDRYDWGNNGVWEILEVTDPIKHYAKSKCVSPNSFYKIGYICEWWIEDRHTGWTYLGNFSKSSNFRDIYDILNDGAGS